MDEDDDSICKINLFRILEEHSYHKMTSRSPSPSTTTHQLSPDKSALSISKCNGSSAKRKRSKPDAMNISSPTSSTPSPVVFDATSVVSSPISTVCSYFPPGPNLNEGNVNDYESEGGKSGIESNIKLQGNVKNPLCPPNKSMKKARVEDIIMNIKKGKTVATKKKTVNNDNSSFASMCTIREELDDIELIDLPPLKPSPPQPEMKRNNNTVFLLQTEKPVIPISTVYVRKCVEPVPSGQACVKQVINPNLIQKVKKQVKQQIPLLLSKSPPSNILTNDALSNNLSIQTQHPLSNPTGIQKQFLLITRPKNPVFLQKLNGAQPGGSSVTSVGSLTGSGSNVVRISRSSSEVAPVDTSSSLITVQYHLPYPNNVCKIVSNPSPVKYTYQTTPHDTLGNLYNLQCNETNSISTDSVPPEIQRAIKSMEIPVSLAGNQPAFVTSISAEHEVDKQSGFGPSYVYGNPHETFTTSSLLVKRIDGANGVDVTCRTESPIKHSAQGNRGIAKRATGQKNPRGLRQNGKESLSKKKTTKLKISANFPGSVNLDDISRTLSSQQPKTGQANNAVANVRVSSRKKHRTEKAKMLEKTKKRANKKKKESLNGKMKEKVRVKIKTEPFDECDVTKSPLVSLENANKNTERLPINIQDQKRVHNNSRDGGTSSGEVVNSSEDNDESGNLFRDPALLTREERALQRALLMFKEMEVKQSRKKLTSQGDTVIHKPKRNLRKGIQIGQFNKSAEASRKRKLGNKVSANDGTFEKMRKIKAEKQSLEKNTAEISRKPTENPPEKKVDVQKNLKKLSIQLDDAVPKSSVEKHPAKKQAVDCIEDKKVSSKAVEEPCKKIKLVKDVSNIPKPSKVTANQSETNTESPHDKAHRVKTYMLVPSYHGFQDFSPIVLGSRTRNKKADKVKRDEDDEVIPVKKAESPRKDIPLLVIETVNNKPVKQDVLAKDEVMRDFVKSSLCAQGMLKKELFIEKSNEDDQFENREKRNLTVNRNTGETVLHKAARMGYDETVYHSIQQGCNSNAKDYAGWTPLHEACSRGHPDVVKVLAKYNADVNACSNDGIRPMHDAADNGNTDVLRLLISYGADPLLNTYSGRSCISCAKNQRAQDYIKGCIGDLYLTDERNSVTAVDYEDRWEFRGSCSILDGDAKYMSGIFDNVPEQRANTAVEFECSDVPHLQTYNLPLIKDGVVVGRKNYVILKDVQEALGKPRNTLIKMLKRTEIREVSRSEFYKEVSKSSFNKLSEPVVSTEQENVELLPLNWNLRSLLKIRCKNVAM